MSERDPPDSRAGLKPALGRLLSTTLSIVATRVELASVELAEERERVQKRVALLLGGVLMLAFAVLGVAAFVVVWFWETNRLGAIAGVTLAFVAIGALLVQRAAAMGRGAAPPFSATVGELRRDREMIARALTTNEPGAP